MNICSSGWPAVTTGRRPTTVLTEHKTLWVTLITAGTQHRTGGNSAERGEGILLALSASRIGGSALRLKEELVTVPFVANHNAISSFLNPAFLNPAYEFKVIKNQVLQKEEVEHNTMDEKYDFKWKTYSSHRWEFS